MLVLGFVCSLFVGLIMGLIGGGGSILSVPLLVYVFHLEPHVATGDSLFIVGSTAMVGSLGYFARNQVNLKAAWLFAAPSLLAVTLTRRWIIPLIPEQIFLIQNLVVERSHLIMALFAIFMSLSGFAMILRQPPDPPRETPRKVHPLSVTLSGFGVGCLTGAFGAGGGFLIVPVLTQLLGFPIRQAIGTSLAMIAINCLWGFVLHLATNQMEQWTLVFEITAVAALGLGIGFKLSPKFNEVALRKAFGWIVIIVGLSILSRGGK